MATEKKISILKQKDIETKKFILIKEIENFQKQLERKLELKEVILKYKEQEQLLLKTITDNFKLKLQEHQINLQKILINKKNIDEKIKVNDVQKNECINDLKKNNLQINETILNITNFDEQILINNEKRFEKRKFFYQSLISQGNLVKSELSALEQKKKLSFDEKNPSCPLCEQNLSASRKKFLKQQFEKQEKFYNHRFKRISALIIKLKKILLQQHEEIKTQKNTIDQNKISNLKLLDLNKIKEKLNLQIKQTEQLNIEMLESSNVFLKQAEEQNYLLNQLNSEEKNLINANNDYTKLKNSLVDLENKYIEINYDQSKHKEKTLELQNIESMLLGSVNLEELNKLQSQRKYEIVNLCKELKKIKNELLQNEKKFFEFNNLNNHENEIKEKEESLINALKELLNKKEILLHKQGSLENQKSKLDNLFNEQKSKIKLIKELEDYIEEYKAIAVALGKDGIQALLIEDAIPEIETEANELLAKLTDNQAQIFIESLRDLKKGGSKETLDIKISDNFGIRPYEMFSGGEAFRIDFALRIAISKLLARRAGTSLQTLIIDEGFGSQDEEGLTNIMDSLYKIQDDFAKIIIVSHLPTMKDQFPVHFFVEKSPGGSKVSVFEQG